MRVFFYGSTGWNEAGMCRAGDALNKLSEGQGADEILRKVGSWRAAKYLLF